VTAAAPAVTSLRLGCALSILLSTAAAAPAEDLRVCLLENDLPRASRAEATGFDHDLFQEAARRLGRDFVPVWRPNAPFFSEVEDTDLPLDDLVAGDCDLAPSIPGRLALGRLADEVELSPPYYAAALEIYMPQTERIAWEDLPAATVGRKVAVRLQSLGHFAAQAAGLDWTSKATAAEVIQVVEQGGAAAALIWGPTLARLEKTPVRVFEPPAGLRFNEHAAVRARDDLAPELARVLAELRGDGTLEQLATRYGILRTEPFPTVSSPAAIRALGIGGP
jgi:ABC-type amino acid transport substrate-binding protein